MPFYSKYHTKTQPIPKGYQIYEDYLEVQGVSYRKKDAMKFAKAAVSKPVWLTFELEPDNPEDRNAIKIIGCISEKRELRK